MRFEVDLDDLDLDAVRRAIAVRQSWRVLPEGGGCLAGRLLAEVCRGWLERADRQREMETD